MAKKPDKNKSSSGGGYSKEVTNNGNHLLTQFERVYGAQDANDSLRKTINSFNNSGAGVITEKYKMGQYGYSVSLKVGDQVITDPSKIKDIILKNAPASSFSKSQYPNDQKLARENTHFWLSNSSAGGSEKVLTNRFAGDYASGDKTQANQMLTAAYNKYMADNPGKIRVMSTNGKAMSSPSQLGQPGAFIQVLMPNGEWINKTDVVEKRLGQSYLALQSAGGTLPLPPTSVGTPVSVPPAADGGAGSTPPTPTTDSTGSTPPDTTDPGATGTTPTDPNTGDPTTTDPAAGEATPDPADEAAAGGTTGTPPTPDTADNAGATDQSTLDTKRKGVVASKANLRRQERISGHPNDVDLTKAAQASQALLAADRNGDNEVSKKEQRVLNPADSNNNGKLNAKELNKYVATVDLDKDGKVKPAEAKAFRTLDGNDNNNVSKKELKAYSAIAGKDGNASRQELKQALKAQIDSKQDQRKHDIAAEALRRTNEKQGGSALVGQNSDALLAGQIAKRNNKDDDGPGGKHKGKNKGKG